MHHTKSDYITLAQKKKKNMLPSEGKTHFTVTNIFGAWESAVSAAALTERKLS